MCASEDKGNDEASGEWLCSEIVSVRFNSLTILRNTVGSPLGLRLKLEPTAFKYIQNQALSTEAFTLEEYGMRNISLEPDRRYRLSVWLRPSTASTTWRLETEDVSGFITNTNDGITASLTAVPIMSLIVVSEVLRNPPQAAVHVKVTIKSGEDQSVFPKLQMLMPYGFAPNLVEPMNGTRMLLSLDMDAGVGVLDSPEGQVFSIRVTTPFATNKDPRWFVLAKTVVTDVITGVQTEKIAGWGQAEGFGVAPCPVTLNFGSVPELTAWLALSFYIPKIARGIFALITAPRTFDALCPEGSSQVLCERFVPVADMPSYLLNLNKRTLNVTLVNGVVEGDNLLYSFLLNVINPKILTIAESWTLRILDRDFTVVDSHLTVAPPAFQKDLEMGNPSLSWLSPPQMGEVSMVSVEVSFKRRVKDMKAVLISLPENYRHDIKHKNQLKNINKNFPVAIDLEWRIFPNLRWIRILVEVSSSGTANIVSAGTYRWQFPVMVPLYTPFNTEWFVTLCKDYSCVSPKHTNALSSFPVPNNEPQKPPITFKVTGTTAAAQASGFSLVLAVLLILQLIVL